jgi:hypothetical protein
VGDHKPPHFREVADWMDRFISTVQENWYIWTPTELAAYGLWRLNWIHPFVGGMAERPALCATTCFVCEAARFCRDARYFPNASEKTVWGMNIHSVPLMKHGKTAIWILRKWRIIWLRWCRRSLMMTVFLSWVRTHHIQLNDATPLSIYR